QYAHVARPGRQADDRVDFTETLFWSAAVQTDAKTGKASVSFDMSDAVTAFRVAADGVSPNGDIGAGTSSIKSVKPFYVEAKMPLQLTAGDTLDLPVALINGTQAALQARLSLSGKGLTVPEEQVSLRADSRERRLLKLVTTKLTGNIELV